MKIKKKLGCVTTHCCCCEKILCLNRKILSVCWQDKVTSGKLDQEVLDITGKGKEIELNWGAPSERSNKNENEINKEIRPIKKYKGNAESDQGIVEDEIKTASS